MPTTTKRHRTTRPASRAAEQGYVSHCKLCPYGVFAHQPHQWLTDPIGWSHTECAQRAGLTAATTP